MCEKRAKEYYAITNSSALIASHAHNTKAYPPLLLKQHNFHDIMEKIISMIVPSDFLAISDDDERRGVY